MSVELFVTCQETLEEDLQIELQELGFSDVRKAFCGVYVPYSIDAVYKINYLSRIAGRVLYPLADFVCRTKETLYDQIKKIPFDLILSLNKTFAIDVNGQNPGFTNTFFAAQVTKDAICDAFREKQGQRPSVSVKDPDVQLNLFLERNRIVLSLDTSGDPLFKRGYRRETVQAPVQESLAAAILRKAKYTKEDILLDPTCGSATFLIEAALMASHTAPGFFRKKWGFFNHPEFSEASWIAFKNQEDAKRVPLEKNRFFGFDLNKEAVRVANANLRFAGLHEFISVKNEDFRGMWELPNEPNLMISNPPHGGRLGSEDQLVPLYRALGDLFKQKIKKPGRAYVFTSSLVLAKEVGLKPKQRHVIKSSGNDCRLLEFDIY
jgi:putative N6-adenine-specific DNA methylase